jgi:hypothetical protein
MRVEDDAATTQAEQPGHHGRRHVVGAQSVDDDDDMRVPRGRLLGRRQNGRCQSRTCCRQ